MLSSQASRPPGLTCESSPLLIVQLPLTTIQGCLEHRVEVGGEESRYQQQ